MFKLIIVFSVLVFSKSSFAQESPKHETASRFRPGLFWYYDGLRVSKLTDARKYDRFILDLVHSDWMSENAKPFSNHWASIGFNTQFMFDIPLTNRNLVSIGIGLGYGHTKIRSNHVVTNFNNTEETQLVSKAIFPNLDKSIFKTNTLFVPLELRLRTPGWEHFKIHVGGRFGLQMGAKTKNFSSENGQKSVEKKVGFQDLNRWLFSVHTRVGIRNWALTASYNLTPYFQVSKSNQINGLEVGLSVSLF